MQTKNQPKYENDQNKQLKDLVNDQKNVFVIQNPEVLPPMTKASKQILKNLLHSSTLTGFQSNVQNWIQHLSEQKKIKQMLIKVKEQRETEQSQHQIKKPKFYLQLYPQYQNITFNHYISNNTFVLSSTVGNLSKNSFRQFYNRIKWNYRHNEVSVGSLLSTFGHWGFGVKKKWGKPLNQNWVTDCRSFVINYLLNNDSRIAGRSDFNSYVNSCAFFQLKGYETRLKRSISEQPGLYSNEEGLKKIDIIQVGYMLQKSIMGSSKFKVKLATGTDYYHTWYYSVSAQILKNYRISNNIGILTQARAGMIDGKNLIPHQMFSRNLNKWMGERSKMFGQFRVDLLAKGIAIFQSINIVPSNYLSIWASRSQQNKVKLQAEIGISLLVPKTAFQFDFSLLRLAGIKGQPRFGLKYQF